MKHLFTFLAIALSFSIFSQRNADLDVKIISPSSPVAVDTNETFQLEILVSNLGSSAITADDSLFMYATVNGDTVQFPPQGNYEIYQSAIAPGGTFTIMKTMAFNGTMNNSQIGLCVSVQPVNSASPIGDNTQNNNRSCITVEVGEQTAGIGKNTLATLTAYPNPVAGLLTVSSDSQLESIRITDAGGKTIAEIEGNDKIDCSELPEGLYFLNARTSTGNAVEKFVIQRN